MTKKEIKNEFVKMIEENKVVFENYDWDSLNNETINHFKWNSGKVRYIQHYFNSMLNNWEFETAERLLKTKSLNNALKIVEYYNNDPYNSFTWPDGGNKVGWTEQE